MYILVTQINSPDKWTTRTAVLYAYLACVHFYFHIRVILRQIGLRQNSSPLCRCARTRVHTQDSWAPQDGCVRSTRRIRAFRTQYSCALVTKYAHVHICPWTSQILLSKLRSILFNILFCNIYRKNCWKKWKNNVLKINVYQSIRSFSQRTSQA